MNKQQGITLVELMVAVAVIGLLAAIILPAYSDYRLKTNATSALNAVTLRMAQVADAFGATGALGCTDSVGSSILGCSGAGQLTATVNGVTVTMAPTAIAGTGALSWNCTLTPASTPKIKGCGL
ncbi:prepilin-type N-terminal cleavage/methylation domain-containing protein [Silanimonas sp.]|jgi:prepilin-type N-terminal cleavage/methylation domain-containing protein|uniref:pilin n=1 Tax=Silanimonas sp. TaxID=1929290 RepID=UPI0022BE959F|nr:prepilin-type N-terminal cleavage/methylation domain-containing protein [Silanimonas sp.]MCZ8115374.1 prepilin-type N-terminal cleavage/methylation domain-containing protein [Silanimonas sp.]